MLQTIFYKVWYKVIYYYIGVSTEIRDGILSSSGLINGLYNGASFSKLFFAGFWLVIVLYILVSYYFLILLLSPWTGICQKRVFFNEHIKHIPGEQELTNINVWQGNQSQWNETDIYLTDSLPF